MNEGCSLKAIEAQKDVHHATVGNVVLVANRVKLPIEQHGLPATRAFRYLFWLQQFRLAAKPMPRSDFWVSPLEAHRLPGLFVERCRR